MNTSICAKYQKNKVENIEQKHVDALKRINSRVHIRNPDSVLTVSDIEEIFKIIDDVFFSRQISAILKSRGIELIFNINSNITSTAGYCKKINDKKYLLSFSIPIMKKLFSKDETRYELGGLQCRTKIECMYHVICHELIHFIAHIECPELVSSQRGHNGIFKKMIKNIFGHTNCHHSLHEDIDTKISALEAVKANFKIGDVITTNAGKRSLQGRILSITNKRVKILTADNRKFYIAPSLINNDRANAVQPVPSKNIKCTAFKSAIDCGTNLACSWSSKTNKCSKTRTSKKQTTRKPPQIPLATATCTSYTTETECSKNNCVWGKTQRCSKKRTRL